MGDTMMVNAVGKNLREYLCRVIGCSFDSPDDYNYRKRGDIDSLGLVRLVLTLETKLFVVFADAEIESPEFSTIGGLMKIIEGKMP